jgi:hypothetical protein
MHGNFTQDDVSDGDARRGRIGLVQDPDSYRVRLSYPAAIWLNNPCHNFEQGTFPVTISPNNSDSLILADPKRDVCQ